MVIDFIGYLLFKLDNIRIRYVGKKNTSSVNNHGGIICGNAVVSYPSNITIGQNSYINGGHIIASPNAKIVIGSNCLISYNVHIRTSMHNYSRKDVPISKQGSSESDVIIGDDVWIGYGAQIMPGVTVAKGGVIGAGAIVTKNTEPYGVYVGCPAKLVKKRE